VTFTGSISDDDVRHEYDRCDIFCLPSVQEGFGIVFLEAMAMGKPVVSTTAAAIPEVVQHGETGILVAPGDVHALAGALLLLLIDHERRERYGAAGRRRVEQYDWSRVAETFLQEIAKIM
jgi:glycosyltransferase involved in cell wall biosynthesis